MLPRDPQEEPPLPILDLSLRKSGILHCVVLKRRFMALVTAAGGAGGEGHRPWEAGCAGGAVQGPRPKPGRWAQEPAESWQGGPGVRQGGVAPAGSEEVGVGGSVCHRR